MPYRARIRAMAPGRLWSWRFVAAEQQVGKVAIALRQAYAHRQIVQRRAQPQLGLLVALLIRLRRRSELQGRRAAGGQSNVSGPGR